MALIPEPLFFEFCIGLTGATLGAVLGDPVALTFSRSILSRFWLILLLESETVDVGEDLWLGGIADLGVSVLGETFLEAGAETVFQDVVLEL